MFLSADTLNYMLRLGLDSAQVVELVRRLETDAQSVAPVPDATREKKRERDRERYRQRVHGETASETEAESTAKPLAETGGQDAPAPTCERGENNLSRLVDTCPAVVAETREPGFDWPPGKASDHARILVEMARSPKFDPAKQLGLVTTTGRLDAWRREGASWEHDVVPIVTSGVARKTGPPINTWKFFDPAIAQSIADNRRALEIPAANGPRHEQPPRSAKFDAKQANMERSLRGAEIALGRRAV